MTKNSQRKVLTNLFLLCLSVSLFYLANPNELYNKGFGFLAWIYYVPIFLLISRTKFWSSLLYGFFFGLFFYLSFAYWLANYGPVCLIFICLFYAFFYALYFLFLKFFSTLDLNYNWLFMFLVTALFEFVKTKGFLGFNYGMTAYTQWNYTFLIQICDIIGAYGLNILMIFSSALIYSFIQKRIEKKLYILLLETNTQINQYESHLHFLKEHKQNLRHFSYLSNIIFLVFFGIVVCFVVNYKFLSGMIYNTTYESVNVVAIQHNEDPDISGIKSDRLNFRKLYELTDSAFELYDDIDIVLWPETAISSAIPYNWFLSKNAPELVSEKITLVKNILSYLQKRNQLFVFGNNGFSFDKLSGRVDSPYNSVIVYNGGQEPPEEFQVYKKIKLVPFTEGYPFGAAFPKLHSKVEELFGYVYEPGTEYKVFKYKDLYFSTPICFEDTFTEVGREMYKNGARCFLSVSNDSWSKSSACQYQHLSMAVFRCVENRIPAVRSTSSGVTCMINLDGKVCEQVPEFCKSFLYTSVPIIPIERKATFYSLYGDSLDIFTFILIFILLLIPIIIVIIKKILKKGA